MSEQDPIDEAVTELLRVAQEKYRYEHARLIGSAAYYAASAHKGQTRKTGEPYVLHPIRVAKFLLQLSDSRVDVSSVCAALLHDTLEDTDLSQEKISKEFGRNVTGIVQILTKKQTGNMTKLERDQQYHEQLKQYEKTNPQALLIKIADVVDNAKSLEVHSDKRREQICKNILSFYVPLAKRLEHPEIANQLIEIANKHLALDQA